MRRLFILFIACAGWLAGCEDVIEVDLPTGETRLIVDGLIRVDTTETFIPVAIKVSESAGFFDEIPVASLESIIITYEQVEDDIIIFSGSSSLAEINPGSGIYEPDPSLSTDQRIPTAVLQRENLQFNLLIRHRDREYIAQTSYVSTVPIDDLEQGTGTLFAGDETEVLITYTDRPESDDFYLFDFGFDEFLTGEDEFYQGQQFQFSYFYDQEFDPGTELEISIMGSDKEFFSYMDLIIEQTEQSVGFFETPRATVRGNVVDITDRDNMDIANNTNEPDVFPLGYFAIVQEFKETLVIQ